MRKILLISIAFLNLTWINAQEIKIKKNQVFLNDVEILKYEKINLAEVHLYNLNDEEILYYRSTDYNFTHYFILSFVSNNIKIESTNFARISAMGIKNLTEKLISWLVKEKVIQNDGTLNLDKLKAFKEKYNENITE